MADCYVYVLDGKTYINLTNKCKNACAFCIRNTGDGVAGIKLWLDKEPTADDVIAAFDRIVPPSDDIVFCGYGEPTENLEVLKTVGGILKAKGYRIRLNTNGLGNLINGRSIAKELNNIDTVSVSLNAPTAEKYAAITQSAYGLDAFGEVIKFATECKAVGIETIFTVVDVIGEDDITQCKALCKKLCIPLRIREYVPDNYNG